MYFLFVSYWEVKYQEQVSAPGKVITPDVILLNGITYPYPKYLFLMLNTSCEIADSVWTVN